MKAYLLLKLYPRAWRDRYGDELQALLTDRPPKLRECVDLVRGAVDAHLSAAWLVFSRMVSGCCVGSYQPGLRDGMRGAAAMVVGSFLMSVAASLFERCGWVDVSRSIQHLAFPVAMVLMSHVMYLRRQSLIAKLSITGGTLVILTLIR